MTRHLLVSLNDTLLNPVLEWLPNDGVDAVSNVCPLEFQPLLSNFRENIHRITIVVGLCEFKELFNGDVLVVGELHDLDVHALDASALAHHDVPQMPYCHRVKARKICSDFRCEETVDLYWDIS